ncbi:MAG: hypothetical protein EOP88_25135 [Verrucomicrobiaceae bacterium]|nr:MAG: hypothetical protein EOP88_25135 [Verrucomicrobiaceae bacterium]
MKSRALATFLIFSAVAAITGCDRTTKTPEGAAAKPGQAGDIPILPVTKGDRWVYDVRLEIPADVTSPGAAEVDANHERVRTYIGKVTPAEGLPETDCFEVSSLAAPTEREFVEILDDRVLMRGSMIMRPETTRPMWLDHPVPFVIAGMKAGTESPEINAPGGSLSRKTRVVSREDMTVPAGTFPSIRLLMTGMDGELELRRTIWFAPGTGIVREEKSRYRQGKLIYRETHVLTKLQRAAGS